MKNICIMCALVCAILSTHAQSLGDYRTANSDTCLWSLSSNWEVFNGYEWKPATTAPCITHSPEKITICGHCTIITDINILSFPIQKLQIDSMATLIVQERDFICSDSVLLKGTITNTRVNGNCTFLSNLTIDSGTIWSKYIALFTISSLDLRNSTIESDLLIVLDIQDSCIIHKHKTAKIGKASLFARTHTVILGTIEFTSTAGTKEFFGSVHIHEGAWINTTGETFTFYTNLFVQDSYIENTGAAVYTIHKNLILESAHFPRTDTTLIHAQYIIHDSIICTKNSYSTIEIGSFDCNTIDIFGNLDFTGKVGQKSFRGNCTVHETGNFQNTDNESFSFGGDITIHGIFSSGTGIFYLDGIHKYIRGGFECYRLHVNGIYTNTCTQQNPLFIKDVFRGNGTIIQATNSYLKTRAPESPTIIAESLNCIEFTGNKSLQTIRGGVYHTIILDNPTATYILDSSLTIINSLVFRRAQLLDVNGYALNFTSWHSHSLIIPFNIEQRIILSGGSITALDVEPTDTVFFPVAINALTETYAGITITNNDSLTCNFTVDSVVHSVSEHPYFALSSPIQTQAVQCTYYISSECTQAFLSLFWHAENELPFFEKELAAMYHYTGLEWEELEYEDSIYTFNNSMFCITAHTNSFSPFCIASNTILLPLVLSSFIVEEHEHNNLLTWHTESEQDILFFTLEKSYTGIDFSEIARIQSEGSAHTPHSYEYTDFHTGPQCYYRLSHTDINGTRTFHYIVSTRQKIPFYITHATNSFEIRGATQEVFSLKIYTITGTLQESTQFQNYYETPPMSSGLYLLTLTDSSNNCTSLYVRL